MRRVIAVALTSFALALSNRGPAFAQGKTAVAHGAGGSSCGEYVEVYDAYRPFIDGNTGGIVAYQATANYWQYEEWIEGYIFGMDTRVYGASPLRYWDRAGMRVWIYNHCQQHPVDFVANAALAFFKELDGKLD